ncbi:MAG: class I SAM-dependent methyltransferase [Gemmatimonadales bacterium]
MSNDDVYASGLLNRALDPETQPEAIQSFLRAEIDLLREMLAPRMRVLDVGCGTGRHLLLLGERLAAGVGVDYELSYVADAQRQAGGLPLFFVAADATRMPLQGPFDLVVCVTNTWGTMSDKEGVLREMRRLAPGAGTRFLSVYSPASIPARREWYRRLGHNVTEETAEYLQGAGGFRSEHFDEGRLRKLVGDCSVRPLTSIAYAVTF